MGNMPMMNDMKNMMGSMSAMHSMGMMHMMGMMGRGMDGMATIDRVEGRIAFLRAELKITDAQADAWNGFADALRTNARKLAEVRAAKARRWTTGFHLDRPAGPAGAMASRRGSTAPGR